MTLLSIATREVKKKKTTRVTTGNYSNISEGAHTTVIVADHESGLEQSTSVDVLMVQISNDKRGRGQQASFSTPCCAWRSIPQSLPECYHSRPLPRGLLGS